MLFINLKFCHIKIDYLYKNYIYLRYASTSAPSGSSSSTHDSGPSNFFGTGYKLGQTENDTEGLLNTMKLTHSLMRVLINVF